MKTLFYGGSILTMDAPMYAQAVLVENGRILALGNLAELEKQAGECRKVNLEGKVLLPGFIDPHSHFFQVATSLLRAPLNGADSAEEIAKRVSGYIRDNHIRPGAWVIGGDYDNNLLPGCRHPGLAQLDAMAPNNPLVIHHKSGHMGLLNSRALELVGITADTPSPEGGMIEKTDGALTGYLEENAFFQVIRQVPMPETDEMLAAFRKAQKKYESFGITTFQEGMVSKPMLPMYRLLLEQSLVELDLVLYSGLDTMEDTKALLAEFPQNTRITSGGYKMFLDGSPQGRTAWMRTPYADTPDYSGYGTMTDEAVEEAFETAARNHAQIIAHCNGDGAAAQFLRCLERAEKNYPELKDLRPVIIHGQLLDRDQIPKVRELGAMVSFFVAHVYHWGDVHIRNFGPERAARISAAHTALDAGVPFTFHQDAPVIDPDMLETVWCAVNRITRAGTLLGPEERISVEDALKAVTVNAAVQYGRESEMGSIAPGKKADFVLLDADPLKVQPEEIRKIQVLATFKEGTCVYRKGEM